MNLLIIALGYLALFISLLIIICIISGANNDKEQ